MEQSFIHLYLSSGVICLLLAVGFLVSQQLQALPARLLGINYGLYAVQNLLAVLISAFSWEFAAVSRAIIALTLGPAIYFYYSSLVGELRGISKRWWLHLLPAILVFGSWLLQAPVLWMIDYLIIGSFAIYLAVIIRLLVGGEKRLAHLAQFGAPAYRWLLILASLMAINLLIELLVLVDLSRGISPRRSWVLWGGAAVFLGFHALTMVLMIVRAPLIEWMHALQDLRTTKAKPVSDVEAKAVFERWEAMVAERELYKREGGVTLEQAGKLLVLPARQISQAINRVYGGSFSQYLNDCRVSAAQALLRQEAEMPITRLLLEAGFSTKSNFNKEFMRVTGLTPSEYRKQSEKQQA